MRKEDEAEVRRGPESEAEVRGGGCTPRALRLAECPAVPALEFLILFTYLASSGLNCGRRNLSLWLTGFGVLSLSSCGVGT